MLLQVNSSGISDAENPLAVTEDSAALFMTAGTLHAVDSDEEDEFGAFDDDDDDDEDDDFDEDEFDDEEFEDEEFDDEDDFDDDDDDFDDEFDDEE